MASDSDDSAAAKGDSDQAVWPPPPTSPRAVAVRLPAQSLFFLPIPKSLTGFQLPKWAKSAWNCLAIAFAVSWTCQDAPVFGKVLLGIWLLVECLLMLGFFLGAGMVGYARAAFAGTAQAVPPFEENQKNLTPAVWFELTPHMMFFVWGVSVLLSSHSHLINRIAPAFWLGLIVAGFGVAVVNGVKHWLLSRRMSKS